MARQGIQSPKTQTAAITHTAALATSATHAAQRAYDGREAHPSRAMGIMLAAWITVSLSGSGHIKNPPPVKEAGFGN